jgi:predicted enzyme related to lactoylglutathione lyase
VIGAGDPRRTRKLVLHTDHGPEVDLLVDNADEALKRFVDAGGAIIKEPFNIPISR